MEQRGVTEVDVRAMLIWNDPLSSPRFNDGDLPFVGGRQLADITAFSSEEECGVQGRRRRRP
jgi:hypothetical protein